jgi:hypothetical protein
LRLLAVLQRLRKIWRQMRAERGHCAEDHKVVASFTIGSADSDEAVCS